MEIRINKDIRKYTETVFLGLTARQFIFSCLAAAVAAASYFALRGRAAPETVSWACILSAAPFAALGFINYHGMTAERLLKAWIKSEILTPRRICHGGRNIYFERMRGDIAAAVRKESCRID